MARVDPVVIPSDRRLAIVQSGLIRQHLLVQPIFQLSHSAPLVKSPL